MHARIFLGLAAFAISTLHAVEPPRLWTSKDGSATLTASFFKTDGEKVILILPNGRSQIIDKSFLSDADATWVAEHGAGSPGVSVGDSPAPTAKIPALLKGKLVDEDGRKVDLAAGGAVPKYYLFYYSASWCGPCHAFTPELIRFYKKMKSRGADFEVILHPSDRSAEDELAYMKEMRMPWPGLDFDKKDARGIPRSKWGYIPAMVLTDAEGKPLLEVNEDLDKNQFLKKAEDLFKPSGATAQN